MPPVYRKYYARNGIVAYALEGAAADTLFVWAVNDPGGQPDVLDARTMFARWNSGGVRGSRRRVADPKQKTVYFCQKFDLKNLGVSLDRFAASTGGLKSTWGKLAYWSEPVFSGAGFDTLYPRGTGSPIKIGQVAVRFAGQWPESLDDFALSFDDRNLVLTLGFGDKTRCQVFIDNGSPITPTVPSLSVPLVAPPGFAAGALGVSLPWPSSRSEKHPLRFAGVLYEANPLVLPDPGEQGSCRTWRAQLADEVSQVKGDFILSADPRDYPQNAQWLAGDLNSRLGLANATLHSSLFGTKGQRVHLVSRGEAGARLGFVFDLLNDDGSVDSGGRIIFHPEGLFDIPSRLPRRVRARASQGIGALDVLAGVSATEFFSADQASCVDFVSGQPAFCIEGEEREPTKSRRLLEDKKSAGDRKGRVTTSFVRFADRGGSPVTVDFHSEPSDGPLFEKEDNPANEHLVRRRQPYGQTTLPMPVFLWAGFAPEAAAQRSGADAESMRVLEANILTLWRRLHTSPVPLTEAARRPDATEAGPALTVTPQGVLAEVTAEGYVRLLFGNPDASGTGAVSAEFAITLAGSGSELFQEIQQTLAGPQLFLVFFQPSADALAAIHPDPQLSIGEFNFSVELSAKLQSRASEPSQRSIFIVKYFKGKSIAELVKDETTWGLRRFLVPTANGATIEKYAHFAADPNQPIPADLQAIWGDPDWQGVLVLNLPIPSMPALLEALRPGITGELLAHHFGLSALPVRQFDLTPPAKPRLGSAFGLIQYTWRAGEDPPGPETVDHEPGAGPGPGDRKYSFIVNKLSIGFLNSQVSSFEAEVAVGFTHLFWDQSSVATRPFAAPRSKRRRPFSVAPGILLFGTYERRVKPGGGTEDVFGLSTNAVYRVKFSESTSILDSLELKNARLSVLKAERQTGNNKLKTLTAFLGMSGDLILKASVGVPLPWFKVRALHIAEFGFQYDYTPDTQKPFTFGFHADGISADIEFDPPSATSSLLELLPVRLKGMAVAFGDSLLDLAALGYRIIEGVGSACHFGIVLELDLGFLGKLAGDVRGLRFPMIVGWGGGTNKGVALGIQFPTFNGEIDIGIQQFIRLRADKLTLTHCPDGANGTAALAIQLSQLRVVMFGREWPDPETKTTLAILVPVKPSRRVSWALGVTSNSWLKYVGGGQRIVLPGPHQTTKDVVAQYENTLNDPSQVCSLINYAEAQADGWSVVARFSAGVDVWFAVSDAEGLYGLVVNLPVLGEIDVLYRRISDQLGIFSAEYTLPEALRTIQVGAATIRFPTFRMEVHTDGGFLLDFGFPWNNDFSRSCQVEVTIFLGSGGFYYGRTAASASDLLAFPGGYGYEPDPAQLARYRSLRMGFAARVGLGRSFTLGILSAEASITVFGGIEGAAGYPDGDRSIMSPTIYGLNGFVGLMLDARAEVRFPIIQARAHLLVYALVGIELRRVLARQGTTHYYLQLPTVIYAEVGLTVSVDVVISIGCVSITIHLSFSASWRFEHTLTGLVAESYSLRTGQRRALPERPRPLDSFTWNPNYRCWAGRRDLTLFITVFPCMAAAEDVGRTGEPKPCAVGQMLLPVRPAANAFVDLVEFLAGWVLRPSSTQGIPNSEAIKLEEVTALRQGIHDAGVNFWIGFQLALVTVVANQFRPTLNKLSAANAGDPFANIPFWPETDFRYVPKLARSSPIRGQVEFVTSTGVVTQADDEGFANYCSCVITGVLAELESLLVDKGHVPDSTASAGRNDPRKYLTWGEIWNEFRAPLDVAARAMR